MHAEVAQLEEGQKMERLKGLIKEMEQGNKLLYQINVKKACKNYLRLKHDAVVNQRLCTLLK